MLGWFGFTLLSFAYVSITLGLLSQKSKVYPALSGLGACLMALSSFYIGSHEAVVLNVVWIAISFTSVIYGEIKFPVSTLKLYFPALFITLSIIVFYHTHNSNNKTDLFLELGGTFGVCLYISGYFYFTQQKISEAQYYIFNILGGIVYLPRLWTDHNLPVFWFEFMCFAMTILGILRLGIAQSIRNNKTQFLNHVPVKTDQVDN